VRIEKVNALTRENVPGALVRLQGMTARTVVTEDGQSFTWDNTGVNLSQIMTAGHYASGGGGVLTTVDDGWWQLEGLPYGFYMVVEERAPDGCAKRFK